MNLIFDLQLFTDVTVSGGVGYSSKTYNLSHVELSAAFASSNSVVASFNHVESVASGLGVATMGASEADDALVSFGNSGNTSKIADRATLAGGGSYTWELNSDTIGTVDLRKNAKLVLYNAPSDALDLTVGGDGGQSVKFENRSEIKISMKDTDTIGSVAFLGDRGNVSLLSGSSVNGATVSGLSGELISLATDSTNEVTLNLKGSDSEAFVTLGGANGGTVASGTVSGFKSIVFDGQKADTKGNEINLSEIKSSAVSILGGDVADTINLGNNVNSASQILINSGKGADEITLSGTGYETLVLATGHGADTVTRWYESAGDVAKGNAISLKAGIDTFYVGDVKTGYADVSVGAAAGETFASGGATLTGSDATSTQLGVNLITSDDTYSALLVGKESLDKAKNTKFDKFDYIIADADGTLNLGNTSKKRVVLANDTTEKHWDDVNVYQNVTTVIASSVGNSMLVNGVADKSAYLQATGKNDSIWGGANGVGDSIALGSKATNAMIFTGKNDGVDSVLSYTYAAKATEANAIRFLDGVEYIAASDGALKIGADEDNNVEVQMTSASGGNKVAYGFGTEGDKYVAMVDVSQKGDGKIAYDSLASVYIGQGDTFISVDSAAKDVKLGWDGGAGYVSIGGVDASMATDGAVIVGTTEYAQSITGSSRGASSISGGFVADTWTDDNDDVLTGGGVATKSTTFFVGHKMGRDEIKDLSSKDNIVFLGTKYADLVSDLAPDASDNSLTFKFANGNVIDASLTNGKTMKNLSDVSLYFDDGTYIWNGSEFAKAE